ncbi:MAG: arginine N-succinyltransferase, partial [Burkholderiaceae bacterium]|nr:arginine N-succinyltransferase [Burkholderiaceae bacterium]
AVVDAADAVVGADTPDAAAAAPAADPWLLSNTALQDFRVIVAPSGPAGGTIALAPAQRELLHSQAGDSVRALPLNPRRNPHV